MGSLCLTPFVMSQHLHTLGPLPALICWLVHADVYMTCSFSYHLCITLKIGCLATEYTIGFALYLLVFLILLPQ